MYPDLSYFFHDLFGTELDNWTSIIKTFGFMLAFAFLGAGWVLKSELKRHEKEGFLNPIVKKIKSNEGFDWYELLVNAFVFLILGAKIPYISSNFTQFKGDPASILFSKEGSWGIGLLAALIYGGYYFYSMRNKPRNVVAKTVTFLPHQRTADIVIWSAISGIAGGRLFSILENLDGFARDPIGTVFSGSGLTVYGGIIVGFTFVYWYVKRLGIKPIRMMDISGMAILVGYAIGRLGCQIAGDGDWGIAAAVQPDWWFLPDWLWAYDYPNNVNNANVLMEGCDPTEYSNAFSQRGIGTEEACQAACGYRYCHHLENPVYPTPIYEIIMYMMGFSLLWLLRRKIQIAGILFFMFMIINGVSRFLIEKIRVNTTYDYFGVEWSQAQYISVAFVLIGIGGIVYLYRRAKNGK